MFVHRRLLLKSAVALPALVALDACASNNVITVAVSKFSAYAQEVYNGVSAFANASSLSGLLTSAQASQITTYATLIEGYVKQITAYASTVVPLLTAQNWATGIESAVNDAIAQLKSDVPTLPADVQTTITAIQTVLPLLLTAVELQLVAGTRSSMPTAQAEAILSRPPML